MAGRWVKPAENSAEALTQGLERFDGVEVDVRLSADDEAAVIYHDRQLGRTAPRLEGEPPWVELHPAERLARQGVETFETMLGRRAIRDPLLAGDRLICIELKLPHRRTGLARGRAGERKHLAALAGRIVTTLEDLDVPERSAVFYGFSPMTAKAVADVTSRWKGAPLRPEVRPWGKDRWERWRAMPDYALSPLARNLRRQQAIGAPVMPMAVEYFTGRSRRMVLGRAVGTSGDGLARQLALRRGYPVHLWPVLPEQEASILRAGLTALTDEADPGFVTLPGGSARWTRPASQPLDETWSTALAEATPDEHAALLSKAAAELPSWSSMDRSERREHLLTWQKAWHWKLDVDTALDAAEDGTLPWEAVRLLGHRGCGKDD